MSKSVVLAFDSPFPTLLLGVGPSPVAFYLQVLQLPTRAAPAELVMVCVS